MNNTPTISINAQVNASINQVWDCYNLPEHITHWNFASPDWHCPKAQNDLRPGGKLISTMAAKDGSFGFEFEATYNEVLEHQKIAYTIADGRKVSTMFEPNNNGVSITTEFEAEGQNPPEMQRAGWQAILNNFKNYVESIAAK